MADTDVVQRLRTVLERTGWTPYELSTRAGLSGSHIANILQRGAKRLGAGGDLRAQVDAHAAKVRAEVQAIQEGTMAPRRPPPEKPARRARR